jgi:membrane protein DedA with SNARE-associated domain
VYAVVVAAAVVENFFPPAPADVVITLAAFLSHRGATDARTVYLVTILANIGGALLVYGLARNLGRGFVGSRVGRRLISPASVVAVERNYLRFGLLGLFLARLLPGIRSFTAPFAGLIRLSLLRTLIPITLASALWYGMLTLIGARLGRDWETVTRLVAGLNTTLGLVALAAAAGIAVWLLRRRKQRGRAHMQEELGTSLGSYPTVESRALDDPAAAAVAALLLEMTLESGELTPDELEALERHLRNRWHLSPPGEGERAGDAQVLARRLAERLAPAARASLARRLWKLAFADRGVSRHEEHVMERAAYLLGLGPDEIAAARQRPAP